MVFAVSMEEFIGREIVDQGAGGEELTHTPPGTGTLHPIVAPQGRHCQKCNYFPLLSNSEKCRLIRPHFSECCKIDESITELQNFTPELKGHLTRTV